MEICKYLNNRLVDCPFDNRKHIIPALIAAGASVANNIMQQNANQKARDYNSNEAQKARDYTNYLLNNETSMKVFDARRAGLNPAFMNGSMLGAQPSTPSSPTSPNDIQPLDPMAIGNLMLMQSQARKNKADAEHQEIENKRAKAEDKRFNERYYDPDNHSEIVDMQAWFNDHPGKIPEIIVVGNENGAKGRFEAEKSINELRSKISDVSTKLLKNELDRMVYTQQIKDPLVLKALYTMPEKEWSRILEETNTLIKQGKYYDSASGKFDQEAALTGLEKKLREDNNIMPYIDKAFDGDFSLKDLAKVVMLAVIGAGSRVSVRY